MNYYSRMENNGPVINYTVTPGDNLSKIAQGFNTTVNAIMDLNNLDSTVIYPGQTLNIPTQAPQGMMLYPYVTQPEDSLNVIAQKYGINPNDIKNYNDINSLLLKPNQTIYIPLAKTYVIQSGDTLQTILQKFNLNLRQLIELNPQWLAPGNVITIRE